ncbi:HNH endonuclease [Ruania suaedae]|uniref:HNH endonuclease signature motif containing protein n=1 Tax=Ruania suaedae TaxID=2897774 RepID=UPI001E29FA34|nr:HNH endonuclease signature motif containing protein [Ruania suaedae]UFU02930.1 HNH endonuclease [Ruania suaedae]
MATEWAGRGGAPTGALPLGARFAEALRADRSTPSGSFDAWASHTATVVAEAEPDVDLLALLEQECDGPATPDEALLVEMIAAGDRLVNHVAALQAEFVVELMERRRGSAGAARTVDELAARLATTGYGSEALVGRAEGLVEAPEVWDALRRGVLTPRKAELITEATCDLALREARAVQQHGVAYGEHHTAPQFRRELEAAVLAVDPAGAERVREKEWSRRRVVREPAPHQMEWVSALLSAESAAMAYSVVDGLAADCAAGDPRTLDQRRADAFAELFREILTSGHTPGGDALPTRHGRRPAIRITVTESVLAGDDESPAVLHGYGPISAAAVRRLAADATLEHRGFTGSALRAVGEPVHGETADGEAVHDEAAPDEAAHEEARRVRARWDPMNAVLPPALPRGVPDGTNAQHVVAWVHRRERDGPDPCTIVATELGLLACDSYAPSQHLRDAVLERDQTCRFPGCLVPAWRGQIDHIVPFVPAIEAWAQTVETNLQVLCRRHHQGKTERAFRVERDPRSGITTWWTPTGHVYTRAPERSDLTVLSAQLREAAAAVLTGFEDDEAWPETG